MKRSILISAAIVCVFMVMKANVKPNSLFSDNMILQREVVVPVYGTANDGEKVTVEFCGQKVTTIAKSGKWKAELQPLKPGGPYQMTIQGNNKITINNILIGDIWVCSGQSNMERQLGLRRGQKPIVNWEQEAASANFPQIRQFNVIKNSTENPVEDTNSKWVVCDPKSVIDFTAVGFFFAREIHKDLNVPIGLLFSAVGGTAIDKWTPREAMLQNPTLKRGVDIFYKTIKTFETDLANFRKDSVALIEKWKVETEIANANKTALPRKPQSPIHPYLSGRCGGYYNGMIAPLQQYKVKGVLWYQGEADRNQAKQYRIMFPLMISEWRKGWDIEKMPFLFVQIAPKFDYTPEIREAQMLTFKNDPHTSMAVLADCGDSLDSHPALKQPVGHRLALGAKAIAYGQKITYSGPIYKSMKVVGNAIEVEFDFVGKGLEAKNGELKDFEITGDNKEYVPAKAIIKGDKIVVSAEGVNNPKAVRMGWCNYPHINLFNKDGLPASSFRSDEN
jgi:sialate O-acetylesterase